MRDQFRLARHFMLHAAHVGRRGGKVHPAFAVQHGFDRLFRRTHQVFFGRQAVIDVRQVEHLDQRFFHLRGGVRAQDIDRHAVGFGVHHHLLAAAVIGAQGDEDIRLLHMACHQHRHPQLLGGLCQAVTGNAVGVDMHRLERGFAFGLLVA